MAFGSSGTRTHIFARFFYVIAHAFSMTLEVFLRRKFGERYFRSVHAIVAIGLVFLYAKFNQGIANPASRLYEMKKHFPDSSSWLDTGITLLVILSLWHLAVIYWRARKGEQWYSRSSGESVLYFKFYPFAQTTFQFLVEPALCFGIGYMLRDIDTVGLWIMTASVFLLLKGQIVHQQVKGKIFDESDAEIAMRSPAAGDNDPGSVTIAVPLASTDMNVPLNNLYAQIEPDLKRIIGDIPEVNYVDEEIQKEKGGIRQGEILRKESLEILDKLLFSAKRLGLYIALAGALFLTLFFNVFGYIEQDLDEYTFRLFFSIFMVNSLLSVYFFNARDNQKRLTSLTDIFFVFLEKKKKNMALYFGIAVVVMFLWEYQTDSQGLFLKSFSLGVVGLCVVLTLYSVLKVKNPPAIASKVYHSPLQVFHTKVVFFKDAVQNIFLAVCGIAIALASIVGFSSYIGGKVVIIQIAAFLLIYGIINILTEVFGYLSVRDKIGSIGDWLLTRSLSLFGIVLSFIIGAFMAHSLLNERVDIRNELLFWTICLCVVFFLFSVLYGWKYWHEKLKKEKRVISSFP